MQAGRASSTPMCVIVAAAGNEALDRGTTGAWTSPPARWRPLRSGKSLVFGPPDRRGIGELLGVQLRD